MRRALIAIDPGARGAIAWGGMEGLPRVEDMPFDVLEAKTAKTAAGKPKVSEEVNASLLGELLAVILRQHQEAAIVVESLPLMSASTYIATKQGANWGLTVGAARTAARLSECRAAVEIVTPNAVRRFHGLRGETPEERKAQAVLKALELHPALEIYVKSPKGRKAMPKDGRADAVLMLEYLRAQVRREG